MINVIINTMRSNTEINVSPGKQFSVTESELNVGDIWSIDEHGDIIIILVVDEKDLKSLIFSNEIFRKAEMMRLVTSWSYIIIQCYYESVNHNSVFEGALISLQELGIIIAHTDYSGTSERITQIITRDRRDKRNEPPRNFVTALVTDGEAILLSFPGIGPAKLATLLNECGEVAQVIMALTDPTTKTPLISRDDKDKIRNALELDDDMMLGIIPIEVNFNERQPATNNNKQPAERADNSSQQSFLNLE